MPSPHRSALPKAFALALAASVAHSAACTREPPPHQTPAPSPQTLPPARDAVPSAPSSEPDTDAATPRRAQGLTHEELLRIYGYTDAGTDAEEVPVADDARALPADTEFTGEEPADVLRVRYAISLPDEHASIATERALVMNDQGDRAATQLVGTGLPAPTGMRVLARAGLAGFALVSPEGGRYRGATPDEAQGWFLGAPPRGASALVFRRTDDTIVATRGGFSLVIATEREGALHPLACRTLVGLFLGGDPAATRVGCANARMPTRATLRRHGFAAVQIDAAERTEVRMPRGALALPPAGAAPSLASPGHGANGAFFAPSELQALPGAHDAQLTLTVDNALSREALVFVDDLAIGWVAPGTTGLFVGLSGGRHAVRGRTLDGAERSRPSTLSLPATVRIENAPELEQ